MVLMSVSMSALMSSSQTSPCASAVANDQFFQALSRACPALPAGPYGAEASVTEDRLLHERTVRARQRTTDNPARSSRVILASKY